MTEIIMIDVRCANLNPNFEFKSEAKRSKRKPQAGTAEKDNLL